MATATPYGVNSGWGDTPIDTRRKKAAVPNQNILQNRSIDKRLAICYFRDMIEVIKDLYVGDESGVMCFDGVILHACKEPYHRAFVGYSGRGCPRESDEYYYSYRGGNLALNLIDARSVDYIPDVVIEEGLSFIEKNRGRRLLVHCNRGESRSAGLVFMYLLRKKLIIGESFGECYLTFKKMYPRVNMGVGMLEYTKMFYCG